MRTYVHVYRVYIFIAYIHKSFVELKLEHSCKQQSESVFNSYDSRSAKKIYRINKYELETWKTNWIRKSAKDTKENMITYKICTALRINNG